MPSNFLQNLCKINWRPLLTKSTKPQKNIIIIPVGIESPKSVIDPKNIVVVVATIGEELEFFSLETT